MEINPNENKQRLFIQSFVKQRSQLPSLVFWQNQRQAEEGESSAVEKRKDFRYVLIGLLTLGSCVQVTSSWAIDVTG